MKIVKVVTLIGLFFLVSCGSGTDRRQAIQFHKQANQLAQEGKLDSALIVINQSLVMDNSLIRTYLSKAGILIKLREYGAALSTISKAAELDMINYEVFMMEGQIRERLEEFDEAKKAYQKSLELLEKNEANKMNIIKEIDKALMLAIIGESQKGLESLTKAEQDYQPQGSLLKYTKRFKNELKNYSGEGYYELTSEGGIVVCFLKDSTIVDSENYFIENGVNVSRVEERGDTIMLKVKEKFLNAAHKLGLWECSINS